MTTAPLTYSLNSTCQAHLTPLSLVGDSTRPRMLTVGQSMVCEECGRTWETVETVGYGGTVQVEWQCRRPASVADPLVGVLARLGTLEAANVALTARVSALEGR